MEGMKGKKGGDTGAVPDGTGHPMENQKEQKGVCYVKKQIGEMMRPWIQPEQTAIHHVG
jgi:hypothetical protein